MWNIEILSFIAGAILLFVALVGGGLKIKEIEIPRITSIFRILSAVVGIVFIIIGITMKVDKSPGESPKPTDSIPQVVKVYCPDCKVWNFIWVSQGVQYEGLFVFNPNKGFGKMRVKYLLQGRNMIIQEEMNQVSTDQGQYIAGKNPFDTETFQPISSYLPDNLIMNNESITVFDSQATYETTMIQIPDVGAIIKLFGFKNEDLDF